jgi:hypothetical protein
VQVAGQGKGYTDKPLPLEGVHMALAYYGVTIPDKTNWVETPEGYVIFKNCVIGRTGFQVYKGYEVDKQELKEQGIQLRTMTISACIEMPKRYSAHERWQALFVSPSQMGTHPSC